MLCASTSGRAEKTSASCPGSALKSGISSSTPQPGTSWWICRQVCAYSQAPPSSRSSRATPVTVAYRRPIALTDSATRRGSSVSSGPGLPVAIWQKSQRLVHWSPPIRKVASRSSQHSKMFGQPASSQTVCRPSLRTRCLSSVYAGPVRSLVLIHRSEGGLAVLPAFEDVRAAGFLADRVQALAADQVLELGVRRSGAEPGLDPRRLALDRDLAVAGLEAEHAAAFWCEYHPSRVCCPNELQNIRKSVV